MTAVLAPTTAVFPPPLPIPFGVGSRGYEPGPELVRSLVFPGPRFEDLRVFGTQNFQGGSKEPGLQGLVSGPLEVWILNDPVPDRLAGRGIPEQLRDRRE